MESFLDGSMNLVMSTMFVPKPIISLSVKLLKITIQSSLTKALSEFTRADPILRIQVDSDTKETILPGMCELHLEVYIEWLVSEYNVECITGQPLSYKETIGQKQTFVFIHKKQTGGAGQYARLVGFIEPLSEGEQEEGGWSNIFVNRCIGTNIPPEFYSSCEKGMWDAVPAIF
jgi:elongation factor G